jgi:hypothetical protein
MILLLQGFKCSPQHPNLKHTQTILSPSFHRHAQPINNKGANEDLNILAYDAISSGKQLTVFRKACLHFQELIRQRTTVYNLHDTKFLVGRLRAYNYGISSDDHVESAIDK